MKKGWEVKKLSEIGKVFNGNSINEKVKKDKYLNIKNGLPYIATKDISYVSIINYDNGVKIPFEEKDNFKVAPANTVLICAEGGSAGRKIGFTDKDICFGNKLFAFVSNKANSKFIYHYYFSSSFQKHFATELTGIIGGVSMNKFKAIEIPLPSLDEQQQIVTILDEAFTAIDKAKANVAQNLKNAKELFESELQRVFSSKGNGWEEKKLGSITTKIGSGATPRGGNESYKTEGISLIRSMNVHDLKFKKKNLAFIDEFQAKALANVTIEEEDVLLNITGASVARCCIIPKEFIPARVNQHVSIIRPKKDIISSKYLSLLLTSKFYKDQLLFTGEQGATRQAITKVQIENFFIAFPKSLKEQEEIVTKLDTLRASTKKLEAIYEQKLLDLEELKKSILQKAFSGELTSKSVEV